MRRIMIYYDHALTQNLKGLYTIDLGRKLGFRLRCLHRHMDEPATKL